KLLPMSALLLSIVAITTLAWHANSMTPLSFELTLIFSGAGFGPFPSLTAVAMQNVVPRHQLGISVGTMNFSRNLFATMLIAVFGAIVLAGAPAGQALVDAVQAGVPQVAQAFGRVFLAAAASMSVALIALVVMEEKPLQTSAEIDARENLVAPASRHLALEQLHGGRLRLVGMHHEALKQVRPEGGADGDVGGVAPARHHDAADARRVVAGVEAVPAAAEIDLEPGAEVHRLRLGRHPDVAEIAGAVARRDVHAAAERDGEIREIAGHAAALDRDLGRGLGGAGVLIAEAQVGMHEVADRLHARPAERRLAEARPGVLHLTVGLAVSAPTQGKH